jgi:hypothetical protein
MPVTRRLLSPLVLAILLGSTSARSAEPTKRECVEANDSAQDLRQAGKLREAREKLLLCAATTCPTIVRQDCFERLRHVDAAMPTIVFVVKDAAGKNLTAVAVTMDGQPFAEKIDGTPLQLDPGEHRFVFSADGFSSTEDELDVHEGDKTRHERVVLGALAMAPTREEQVASVAPVPHASDGDTQRIVGLALGGAGSVGIVVGTIFGVVSKATYDHAIGTECGNNPNACSVQGAQDGQTAHGQATASTVGFVAGLALLGGGAVFYFSAPGERVSVGPTVGGDGAGLQVKGAF